MATASLHLSDEQFRCAICLDVFNQPVTTSCGHNFCKTCLEQYWDTEAIYKCPLCNMTFPRRPAIKVNTFLSELAVDFKKWALVTQIPGQSEGVLCDICADTKVKAVRSCLVCLTSFCELHLEPHRRVAGLKSHTLTAAGLEDKMCKNHHRLYDLYCVTDQTPICGVCVKTDHKCHNIVTFEKYCESRLEVLPKTIQDRTKADLEIVRKLTHFIDVGAREARKEMIQSASVIDDLIRYLEHGKRELLAVIGDRWKSAAQQAEVCIKELESEMTELDKMRDESERLSHSDDLHGLVLFLSGLPHLPTKDQKNTDLEISLSDATSVRTVLSQLPATLDREMERLPELKLKMMKAWAVDVTLDPDTAHRDLVLSLNGKSVMLGAPQNVTDDKKRFEYPAVLAKECFTVGKFYYEVEVKGKTSWAVGVARASVDRARPKHVSTWCRTGLWFVMLEAGQYRAWGSVSAAFDLKMKGKPERVGIFVDCDKRCVSFYNVDDHVASHIYTFSDQSFNGRLHPYVFTHSDLNMPLVITPVHHTN